MKIREFDFFYFYDDVLENFTSRMDQINKLLLLLN